MEYRIVNITEDLVENPHMRSDTEEFPFLVDYVEDEFDVFIVNKNDKDEFYKASEFFLMTEFKEFKITRE